MGQGQPCEIQQGQGPGPAHESQKHPAVLQAGGKVAGNLPKGKGSGSAGDSGCTRASLYPGGQEDLSHPGLYGQQDQGILGPASSPLQLVTEQEDVASNYTRECLH